MDTFEKNSTWLIWMLSNATENVTEGLEKVEIKKKVSFVKVIFVLMSVLGFFVNAITIPALSKSKKLRNATTAFIVNLSVADLLYCSLTFFNYLFPHLRQNSVFCTYFPLTRYLVGIVSTSTIVAITVNRYVCVVHPFAYHSLYRPRYQYLMIFATWLYSASITLMPYFGIWGTYGFEKKVKVCTILEKNGKSPVDYIFITGVAYPSLAFLICYPRIFCIVRKATRKLCNHRTNSSRSVSNTSTNTISAKIKFTRATPAGNDSTRTATVNCEFENVPNTSQIDKQQEKEIRIIKVMLVVVIAFIICYLPISFLRIYDVNRKNRVLLTLAPAGVNLSNVINPIIYVVMSSDYRGAYKDFFLSMKSIGSSTTSENI